MSDPEPEPAVGDDKDWSWTAVQACPDCGYDPGGVTDAGLGAALRATSGRWRRILLREGLLREGVREGVRERPRPDVWSPLEYACHVRDVHRLFDERVGLMLQRDDPHFVSWDQDEAAVSGGYFRADPASVADEVERAAAAAADRYDGVPPGSWGRIGHRGDGGVFTVSSIGHYHLHDVVHHLHDVRG